MRGKIGLSLTLALVMLFGSVMIRPSAAQTTEISVNPVLITKVPGDIFQVYIDLANVANLYTFAFELRFAPFTDVLAVRRVVEGGFLGNDAQPTSFHYTILALEGIVQVGNTRLGDVGGVSGSGTLAMIEFKVVEAGDSAMDLANTVLYDTTGGMVAHDVVNGYFNGANAYVNSPALLTGVRGDSAVAKVGDVITLGSSVTHAGAAVPLKVKVRYDLIRKDGRILTLWTPQAKVYELSVDAYDGSWSGAGWTEYGTGALLDAVGDGNYIEAADYCSIGGMFSFEDMPALGPGELITSVSFEAYSTAQSAAIDGDIYMFTFETEWAWMGSIEASSAWDWYFTDAGSMPFVLYDEATINSVIFLVHYWTPDLSSGPTMTIDAARLVIVTETETVINPGESISMPVITYMLTNDDKGVYRSLKAYAYFSYYGVRFLMDELEQPIIVLGQVTPRDYMIVTGKPA